MSEQVGLNKKSESSAEEEDVQEKSQNKNLDTNASSKPQNITASGLKETENVKEKTKERKSKVIFNKPPEVSSSELDVEVTLTEPTKSKLLFKEIRLNFAKLPAISVKPLDLSSTLTTTKITKKYLPLVFNNCLLYTSDAADE